jgi:hypothetical protein
MVDKFDTVVEDASRNFVWNVKVRSSGITAVLPTLHSRSSWLGKLVVNAYHHKMPSEDENAEYCCPTGNDDPPAVYRQR